MTPPTLFSTLSRDEFSRVLTHVDSSTLVPLVIGSALDDEEGAASKLFFGALAPVLNKVYFGISCPTRFDFMSNTLVVNCHGDHSILKKLLEGCGPDVKFTHIIFENITDLYAAGAGQLFDAFVDYLDPNVNLHFALQYNFDKTDFMRTLMSRFAPAANPSITASTVRSLSFDGVWKTEYDECWARIGHSLEQADICQWEREWAAGWDACINKINLHCRKLDVVNLRYRDGGALIDEVTFVDFLCSYGKQLVKTYVDSSLSEEALEEIAAACTNARVKYTFTKAARLKYNFAALGRTLDNLTISTQNAFVNWESLTEAMRQVNSISTFEVFMMAAPLSSEVLAALLPSRMAQLECLRLSSLSVYHSRRDSLLHIATVTNALKLCTINICGPISVQSIRAIVRANPLLLVLEAIENDIQRDSPLSKTIQPMNDISEFIEVFSECKNSHKNLCRFHIVFAKKCPQEYHQEIQDSCTVFRNTGMMITLRFSNGEFNNDKDPRHVVFNAAVMDNRRRR